MGLVAAVLVTACGGAGTSFDTLAGPSPPGTEQTLVGAFRGTPSPAPVPTTTAVSKTSSPFCQDMVQFQGALPSLLAPNQSRAALNEAKAVVDRLPLDAPADIKPVATTLAQTVNRIAADLRSSPPNVADLAPLLLTFQASVQQLVRYAAVHC